MGYIPSNHLHILPLHVSVSFGLHRTAPHDDAMRFVQVLGDGARLGTFTSSGDTLDFENWTLNAKDVSSIKLVARGLRYKDWLSITEASQQF